ncbi:hypothetical protein [Taklimakanibacter albus]|jgi:hypothetical protein|uniref:Uncharacterized protein n=1 Tax=Taklimakanibacter albus TaxID=2800327 RepID=A0ACC5R547_9HYPH|nr:hypothetical protein [Aestuariivirga sp. YIM B02566]MBK1867779.1 hypothetical protein [Aestuariivirga sp. YIM B02566]
MTVKSGSVGQIVFAAEGLAGAACSAALNKVRSLASAAPSGRAFAAIATLSDLSQSAETHLTAGNDALGRGDTAGAQTEWAQAVSVMSQLAQEARSGQPASATKAKALAR